MKRRVFIGLPISKELQNKIGEWRTSYQKLLVRWIKKENLHVTLIPPWYTSRVDDVISSLKFIKNVIKPFRITFREITFGPNPKRPRLIWVGGESSSEIRILKSKLEKTLQIKGEKREFLIHLTIARFKEKDFYKFPIKNLNDKVFWRERISSFLLMESHLARSGAEYERLAEILLTS